MTGESEKDPAADVDPDWVEALKAKHPHDIAMEIRDLPTLQIRRILRGMTDEDTSEIIVELPPHVQVRLLESMRVSRLSGIIEEMFSDDVADLLGQISAERLEEIMAHLPPEEAREISDLLKYEEDTAGGIMQTEVISVPDHLTIAETIEKLRTMEDLTSSRTVFSTFM